VREEAKSIVSSASWPAAKESHARGKFGQTPDASSGLWWQIVVVVAVVAALVTLGDRLRKRRRASKGA